MLSLFSKQTLNKPEINLIAFRIVSNLMCHPFKDVNVPATKTSNLRSQVNLKKVAKTWTKKKIPSKIKPSSSSENLPPLALKQIKTE